MTGLEILLSIIVYISLGLWICQKRSWYEGYEEPFMTCLVACALTPLNLVVVVFGQFILRKWDNSNF